MMSRSFVVQDLVYPSTRNAFYTLSLSVVD